jgi:hypothetical protein
MGYKYPTSGIYTITNLLNNKMYIGYSYDIFQRLNVHKSALKKNIHHSFHLQKAWNKYGENNFEFEILEEYPDEGFILPSMEHYWCNILKTHNSKYGYNIRPTSPTNKIVYSEDMKDRMSRGKIIQYSLDGNFIKLWKNINEIERTLKIHRGYISFAINSDNHISSGFQWFRYTNNNYFLKIPKYYSITKSNRVQKGITLLQYNDKGEFTKEWITLVQAQYELNITPEMLRQLIRSKAIHRKTKSIFINRYPGEPILQKIELKKRKKYPKNRIGRVLKKNKNE